jgi:hypothetical protein
MEIEAGARVVVTTASGQELGMRALTAPRRGRDFPIVWVCGEDSYTGSEPADLAHGIPWPLTDVRLVETSEAAA